MSVPTGSLVGPAPDDHLKQWALEADALRGQRRLEEAAQQYRRVLEEDPSNEASRRGLAATLVLLADLAGALRVVDSLIQDDPSDVDSWRDRAAICRASDDPAELLRSLEAIEALAPTDTPTLLEELSIHDAAHHTEDAYRVIGKLLGPGIDLPDPTSRDELLRRRAELAERLTPAEGGASPPQPVGKTEAPSSAQADAVVDVTLREVHKLCETGRPDEALALLSDTMNATESHGGPPRELVRARADLLFSVDRLEEAQEAYDQLWGQDPTDARALAGAARARIEQGKHPEARNLLHDGLSRFPPDEALTLALAEAESGSGDLLAAERAVRRSVEMLPRSRALWVRLAEIASARSDWKAAEEAYRHGSECDPTAVGCLLGGAFVAEQQDRPTEALALYDRAVGLAPGDARAWTRRGIVLASLHRYPEAVESFDRALGIDPESDAARDGKRLAEREREVREVDGYALAALRLESQRGQPLTKNDLFVELMVPFDQLDPTLAAVSREVPVDIGALEPAAFAQLEERSCRLISRALERRPPGIEARGLSVADVAALADPADSLDDVQRLFGYVSAVLGTDMRPENLRLTPKLEEAARRALRLPASQRTLFALVRTLGIGLFEARVVKTVERASEATRTPLPSVDVASHSPEFEELSVEEEPEPYFAPENAPVASPRVGSKGKGRLSAAVQRVSRLWPRGVSLLGSQRIQQRDVGRTRCVACGGIASLSHACGATLCTTCIRHFVRCPKCGEAFLTAGAGAGSGRPSAASKHPSPREPDDAEAPTGPIRPRKSEAMIQSRPAPVVMAPRPPARPQPAPVRDPRGSGVRGTSRAEAPVTVRSVAGAAASARSPAPARPPPPAGDTAAVKPASVAKPGSDAGPIPPAPPRPRREKSDDEPRL